jgi:hypothetical protein
MPAETAADRLAMLSVADWAVSVQWTHGLTTVALPAIHDDASALVATGDGLDGEFAGIGLISSKPSLLVRDQDLPAGAAEGDTVDVDGTVWDVRGLYPDGTGLTLVRLEEPA